MGASPTFTLHFAGHAMYPPGATFGPRTLHDFEFVWNLHGDAVWEVEGQRIVVGPGSVLLARPGMRDRFEWDAARASQLGFVHFTFTPERIAGLPELAAWPLTRAGGPDDALVPVLEQLIAAVVTGTPAGLLVARSALAHALVGFVTGATGTNPVVLDALPEPVHRSLRFTQERWTEKGLRGPTVSALARAGGVSEGHLVRLYQRTFGCGPAEVLRAARLERAAQMLVRTNLGIADIATSTGFLDPFHFSRAFKQAYRRSPRALRTAVRAGASMPLSNFVRLRLVTRMLLKPVG